MQPCSKPSFPLDLGRVPASSNVADGPSRLDCRLIVHPFKREEVACKWSESSRSSLKEKLRAQD